MGSQNISILVAEMVSHVKRVEHISKIIDDHALQLRDFELTGDITPSDVNSALHKKRHQGGEASQGSGPTGTIHFEGKNQTREALVELSRAALFEICGTIPSEFKSLFSGLPGEGKAFSKAGGRGKVSLVLGEDHSSNRAPSNYNEFFGERSEIELRRGVDSTVGIMVFDQSVFALIYSSKGGRGDEILVIENSTMARLQKSIFDQLWKMSTRFSTSMDRALGPEEIWILKQLKSGNTDKVLADRLGVTERTIRRKISRIMSALQARSRFESGVNAAKQGLL